MEWWGRGGNWRDRAAFLCVCVEGRRVAASFQQAIGFRGAVNAFILLQADMPRFGQLGCSGFVVLDGDAKIVSPKTAALLDDGEAAFDDLEEHLNVLLEIDDADEDEDDADADGADAPRQMISATMAQLRAMKVSDLKALLTGAGVSLAGLVEKADLVNVAATSGAVEVLPEEMLSNAVDDGGDGSSGEGAPKAVDEKYLGHLPSVGVTSMDFEHEQCVEALRSGDLDTARAVLDAHFVHEEALMEGAGFGGGVGSRFSALESHRADHKRILQLIGSGASAAELLRALHEHAEKFDKLYENAVPEDAFVAPLAERMSVLTSS
uniref:Hemerythrin-like domain-containing protein n=1 Tax=Phaeomonas parva TaxID=124430 RepID=A0A6U4JIG0_9STRA|mmetsp:Transcript_43949/g.138136  ORF Transcript_43949/g.138136 Transcript_43949/m.138136 type:complete len:322 (+) Transcript_43949:308-1273(+)